MDKKTSPNQVKQKKQIAASPLKEPQHDTEHNAPAIIEKASEDIMHQRRKIPEIEQKIIENNLNQTRSIELHNDATMDSTVDTDGKIWDIEYRHTSDNTIYSNASLENAIITSPEGLAGFNSQPEIALPSNFEFQGIEPIDKKYGKSHLPEKIHMVKKFTVKTP